MDPIEIARALHVLAVLHWIGGVAFVTLVVLPAVRDMAQPAERIALFERVEGRFSAQAKLSVAVAGASGLYMTQAHGAWDRFLDPAAWWMHGMVAVWTLFALVLFVAEPLVLHRWFRSRAARDPDGTFRIILRGHRLLLSLGLAVAGGAVLGAHGAFW